MRQKFLKCSVFLLSFLLLASTSFAYLSDIKVLTPKEIEKLTDDALSTAYFDVLVEQYAVKVHHQGQGFSPNEMKQFKELLRYQFDLRKELQKRQLDIPRLDF